MKPCSFSLPGDFYDTFPRRAQGTGGKRGKRKAVGMPNLAQIAEGSRPLSVQTSRVAFAVVPPSVPLYRKIRRERDDARIDRENPHARAQGFQKGTVVMKNPGNWTKRSCRDGKNRFGTNLSSNAISAESQKTSPHNGHPCPG